MIKGVILKYSCGTYTTTIICDNDTENLWVLQHLEHPYFLCHCVMNVENNTLQLFVPLGQKQCLIVTSSSFADSIGFLHTRKGAKD